MKPAPQPQSTIRITSTDMWIDGVRQTGNQIWEFAIGHDFKSSREMCDWFDKEHGLPFEGIVMAWK